jgi:hypothetical protein
VNNICVFLTPANKYLQQEGSIDRPHNVLLISFCCLLRVLALVKATISKLKMQDER